MLMSMPLDGDNGGHRVEEVKIVLTGEVADRIGETGGSQRAGGNDCGSIRGDHGDFLAPNLDVRMIIEAFRHQGRKRLAVHREGVACRQRDCVGAGEY